MSRRTTFLALVAALTASFPLQGATDKFALFDDRIPVLWIAVERNANDGGYLVVAARDPNFDFTGRLLEARRIPRSVGFCRGLLPGGGHDGVVDLDCRTETEEQQAERTELGPVVRISEETLLWRAPELSFSPAGGVYLLVYVESIRGRPDGPFGRLLSAEGEPLGEPFRISPEDGCRAADVYGVAYSELTDRWLVAWRGLGAPSRCNNVRARFVRPSGVLGNEVRVSEPGNIFEGDLAYSAERSEFLVVWSQVFGDTAIFGRVIRERESRNGRRRVFAQADRECLLSPRAAGDSRRGRFLVSWVNRCDSEIPVWSLDSRLLEADGSMKRVNRYRTGEVVDPSGLGYSEPSGRFIAVWDEVKPGTISGERVGYTRVFRGGGRPLTRARTFGREASISRLACSARRTECLAVWVRRDSNQAIGGWVNPKRFGQR